MPLEDGSDRSKLHPPIEDATVQNNILDSNWFKSSLRLRVYMSSEALLELGTSEMMLDTQRRKSHSLMQLNLKVISFRFIIISYRGRSSSRSSGGDGSGPSQGSQRPVISLVPRVEGGFDLLPSKVVLDVSRASYRSRMSACWPKWDNIPPYIIECI